MARAFALGLLVAAVSATILGRACARSPSILQTYTDLKSSSNKKSTEYNYNSKDLSTSAVHQALTPEAERDRVLELPGWGKLTNLSIFSGYVRVDDAVDRSLFYTFVESTRDPTSDPLVLWLNGGPGCSSVGGGFFSELGPFLPSQDGRSLQANPYSWNNVANTLFIDSPAFVGFSYSDFKEDAVVGDERTSRDLRTFLLGFMKRFPSYRSHNLYLSGESYAGHYVPNLAWTITKGNEADKAEEHLNLKGIMVGNPWTDARLDNEGVVDFWWSHGLIGDEVQEGLKQNCDPSKIGPLKSTKAPEGQTDDALCDVFVERALSGFLYIDIYDIYADKCLPKSQDGPRRALATALGARTAPDHQPRPQSSGMSISAMALSMSIDRQRKLRDTDDYYGDKGGPSAIEYNPCVENAVTNYLNMPEVQRALHANTTGEISGPWMDCSEKVIYSTVDLFSSMLPVWEDLLLKTDMRLLVYSGDVDGIVPLIGTRRWVAGLPLKQTHTWSPWVSGPSEQVGGFSVGYSVDAPSHAANSAQQDGAGGGSSKVKDTAESRLVLSTVRGAGHMVPYTQPQRALHLIAHFLDGIPL